MKTVISILISVIFCLVMVEGACGSETASPTLNATYDFPVEEEVLIVGFVLNKDGVSVCSSNDLAARQFTCTTQIENKLNDNNGNPVPTIFTLTAKNKYGVENDATSEPFEFFPDPEIFQDISKPSNLNISIPITVNVIVNGMPQ